MRAKRQCERGANHIQDEINNVENLNELYDNNRRIQEDINSNSDINLDAISYSDINNYNIYESDIDDDNISSSYSDDDNISSSCSDDTLTESELNNVNTEPLNNSDDSSLTFDIDFKETVIKCNMPAHQITEMLKLFKRHNICLNLPSCARTLLQTPRNILISHISGMQYYYFGVEDQIRLNIHTNYKEFNSPEINISINIDGIPIYKSTKESCWQILVSCNIEPQTVFPIAITYGKNASTKPSNDDFLRDMVDELKVLMRDGIFIFDKCRKLNIYSFTCDSPARSMIKNVKGHAGFYSCDRCEIKGERINNRMVFLDEDDIQMRTDHSFRCQRNENHHKGDTILLELKIDMVLDFPIDYMHNLCLGIMKRLLNIWLGKDHLFKSKLYRITSISEMNNILEFLSNIIPPLLFSRRPRSVKHVGFWKATEYRLFLLYIGHFVLKDILHERVFKNFLLLNHACLILINYKSSHDDILYAKKLLEYFIFEASQIYGQSLLVYNFHMLTHIADDCLRYNCLDKCSSFKFENYLGKLKKLVRTGNLPIKQMIARILERKSQIGLPKLRIRKININDVYIIQDKSYQVISIFENDYKCIVFNNEKLYDYPADSGRVGIFKSYKTNIKKKININLLNIQAIIINVREITDDDYYIIQILQHTL